MTPTHISAAVATGKGQTQEAGAASEALRKRCGELGVQSRLGSERASTWLSSPVTRAGGALLLGLLGGLAECGPLAGLSPGTGSLSTHHCCPLNGEHAEAQTLSHVRERGAGEALRPVTDRPQGVSGKAAPAQPALTQRREPPPCGHI